MQATEASPTSSATLDLLREELVGLHEENSRLRQENADQCLRLAELEFQLAELRRLVFGARSERFVPEPDTQQGALFEEAECVAPLPQPETITLKRRLPAAKRAAVRQVLPAHLRCEVIVIEPEEDAALLNRQGCDGDAGLRGSQAEGDPARASQIRGPRQ